MAVLNLAFPGVHNSGQPKPEDRSLLRFTLHSNSSALGSDGALSNDQTDANAAALSRLKRPKQTLCLFRRYTGARIDYFKDDRVLLLMTLYSHESGCGVLDRVVNQ